MFKNWLQYWKKSLSDGMRANINIAQLPNFEIEHFDIHKERIDNLDEVNRLINLEAQRINKAKGVADPSSENWVELSEILVLIAPLKIVPLPERLIYLKDKNPVFPFWYYAKLNRKGDLNLPSEFFPIFQRKYLEPLADEKTEFIFGNVDTIDEITSYSKEEYENYQEYITYIKETFRKAASENVSDYKAEGYNTLRTAIVLLPEEELNPAIGIIQLYEKIIKNNIIPPLLKKVITLNNTASKSPVDVRDFISPNNFHLGQMGYGFPLSISQRKSLYTFLGSDEKILAVNGPPGTGKTTLIQSLVANKVVQSVINGHDAPVILASSTNNQAITNIIDSFSSVVGKAGELQGRWLPELEGYATYLTSSRKSPAELKGINYKKLDGDGLFSILETYQYIQTAKSFFLDKARIYLSQNANSVNDVIKILRNEVLDIENIIKKFTTTWNTYLSAEQRFNAEYYTGEKSKQNYFANSILSSNTFDNDVNNLKALENKIITYFNNESFFRKLFCFLGLKSSLRNRAAELRILLRGSLVDVPSQFVFTRHSILEQIDTKIKMATSISNSISDWTNLKNTNYITGNPPRDELEYASLEDVKVEAQKNNDKDGASPNSFYDELDVTLRHKAFQIAVHYWEGRWLQQVEEDLLDPNFAKKGMDSVENRWKRQAMVTPCFVSTFYMAPKFFSYYKFFKQGEDGKNIFDTPPLYEFIDLLIVDEAGQVSPEVGIATFALAKRAIVVGDIKQIEPVWNVNNKIDIGNLKRESLIKSYDDPIFEKEYDPKGFLSSTGSIMKMAQNACGIKEEGTDEKGILLTEHRRCYDEIINYCNVLAYRGKLRPLKGNAPQNSLFPPMYCINVEGNSTVTQTTRFNQIEADTIARWLADNKINIESKYGKLEDSIGIITPFVGQKSRIRIALKEMGINADQIKLGTVHALQGAERPIVLFSMVYGPGDSGIMFFDRENKPNMLNVAVSRAKDSFIVFANQKILDKAANTPSGVLANYLKYN